MLSIKIANGKPIFTINDEDNLFLESSNDFNELAINYFDHLGVDAISIRNNSYAQQLVDEITLIIYGLRS